MGREVLARKVHHSDRPTDPETCHRSPKMKWGLTWEGPVDAEMEIR